MSSVKKSDNFDAFETINKIKKQQNYIFELIDVSNELYNKEFKKELEELLKKYEKEISDLKNQNIKLIEIIKERNDYLQCLRIKKNNKFICIKSANWKTYLLSKNFAILKVEDFFELKNEVNNYNSINKSLEKLENVISWIKNFKKEFRPAFKELITIFNKTKEEFNELKNKNAKLNEIVNRKTKYHNCLELNSKFICHQGEKIRIWSYFFDNF